MDCGGVDQAVHSQAKRSGQSRSREASERWKGMVELGSGGLGIPRGKVAGRGGNEREEACAWGFFCPASVA